MLKQFDHLKAVECGTLAMDSSWGSQPPKSAALQDVQYVLLSPHDAENDPLGLKVLHEDVRRALSGLDKTLLNGYLCSERDAGVDELREEILRTCPGGISISVQTNRGICNANRNADNGEIPDIWLPEQEKILVPILRCMHREILLATDIILHNIVGARKNVKLVCLHSMDPCSIPENLRPALSHRTLEEYVGAQGLPRSEKTRRKQDFITGEKNGPDLSATAMYKAMQGAFTSDRIPWAVNEPYATGESYPDFGYMQEFPGRVALIDVTKDQLCKGEVTATYSTFDSRHPEPNPDKVAQMAVYFKRGLEAVNV